MLGARGRRYASLVIYLSGFSGVALICNTGERVILCFLLLHVLFLLDSYVKLLVFQLLIYESVNCASFMLRRSTHDTLFVELY